MPKKKELKRSSPPVPKYWVGDKVKFNRDKRMKKEDGVHFKEEGTLEGWIYLVALEIGNGRCGTSKKWDVRYFMDNIDDDVYESEIIDNI